MDGIVAEDNDSDGDVVVVEDVVAEERCGPAAGRGAGRNRGRGRVVGGVVVGLPRPQYPIPVPMWPPRLASDGELLYRDETPRRKQTYMRPQTSSQRG